MTRGALSDGLYRLDDEHQDAFADITADAGLASRIRHRRRVFTGGAVASLAILSLAGVGVVQAWDDAEREPAEEMEVDEAIITPYAEVSIDNPPAVNSVMLPFECGDPAPQPSTSEGGFEQSVTPPDSPLLTPGRNPGSNPTAATRLDFNGEEDLPASVSDPVTVFVQDGEVVATDPRAYSSFVLSRADTTRAQEILLTSSMPDCRASDEPAFLPAGDYEVYVARTIVNTPAHAALWELSTTGYGLRSSWGRGYFEPGSFDCISPKNYGSPEPLECSPNAVPGVIFDWEARTVTLPFDNLWYTGDVDITLVAEPFTVTIGEQVDIRDHFSGNELPTLRHDTDAQCDDAYSATGASVLELTSPEGPPEAEDLDFDEPTVFSAVTRTWGRYSQVELPSQARVVFTFQEQMPGESWPAVRVVGHGTAHYEVDNGWLNIDRYDGPAELPVTFSDVQWCGGTPPQEPLTRAHIHGDALVHSADGTTTEVSTVIAKFGEMVFTGVEESGSDDRPES